MSSKMQALRVARHFGFVLDESVSGRTGIWFAATFDHPTDSIGSDCRSIHCEGTCGSAIWDECIDRMRAEGPLLEPCEDPECDYHHEETDQ